MNNQIGPNHRFSHLLDKYELEGHKNTGELPHRYPKQLWPHAQAEYLYFIKEFSVLTYGMATKVLQAHLCWDIVNDVATAL